MKPTNQYNLTFFNPYGLLFEDQLYLKYGAIFSNYSINSLKKIKVIKRRDVRLNALLIVCVVVIIALGLFLAQDNYFKILTVLVSIPFAISSIVFKWFKYNIVVHTKGQDFFKIPVQVESKNAAVELVREVNKVLIDQKKDSDAE